MLKRAQAFLDKYPYPAFVFLLILLCAWVGIFRFLSHPVDGMHFIRQTDGMAFMMGYWQFDVPFVEPRVYNLLGKEGQAAAEFPLFYFLSAKIAGATGPQAWTLRIWYLLAALAGWFGTFRLSKGLGLSTSWSLGVAFIGLSGLVYVYYIFGMVPDLLALGLSMIAWVFVLNAWKKERFAPLIGAGIFFSLAALLKITFLIHPFALTLGFLLFFPSNDYIGLKSKRQWSLRFILLSLMPLLLAAVWVSYVRQYNQASGNWYFLSQATPIWKMSGEQIAATWNYMLDYWWGSYFHPNVWFIWLLVFAFNVYTYRKVPGFWNRLHWVFLAGCLSYLLLFFRQFQDHDYYFILCYSYFIFMFLGFVIHLKALYPRIYESAWSSLAVLLIIFAAFRLDASKYYGRVEGPDLFADSVEPVRDFYQTLDSLQIDNQAPFIVIGDVTHNGSLLYLRRQGFAIHNASDHEFGIMENLRPIHLYQYALSLPGYSFERKIEEWKMDKIYERDGIVLYRIP